MGRHSSLAEEQLTALDLLTAVGAGAHFYLAGGSAVAVHLAHRQSRDLDLFSESPDANLDTLRTALLARGAAVSVVAITDVTLALRVGGCPVDVVAYPYALIDPLTEGPSRFPVAGLRDLAAMKLAAIARRGIRRDFWDLYEIVVRTSVTLPVAIQAYLAKFGAAESDIYHVVKALSYFGDAEAEPPPAGLTPSKWATIVEYFERAVTAKPWNRMSEE